MQQNHLRERTGKRFQRTGRKAVIKYHLSVVTTEKKRSQTAVLLVSILVFTLVCSSCADVSKKTMDVSVTSETYYTPLPPQPIEIVDEAFPEIMDSSLLSLSANFYKGADTTVEDLTKMENDIRSLFNENRANKTPFELPDDFVVHETERSPLFETADTLDEYDKQIWDAWLENQTTSDGMSSYQCHRIGVTALNCMDLISNDHATKAALSWEEQTELLLYYAKLAYWGFGNEYVFGSPSRGARIDLFYRCGQVFDHLKAFAAANAETPPDYYEMCFVAAAFLGLAYQLLEEANFEKAGNEYQSAVWELEQTMLQRMMEYVRNTSGFRVLMRKHKLAIPA